MQKTAIESVNNVGLIQDYKHFLRAQYEKKLQIHSDDIATLFTLADLLTNDFELYDLSRTYLERIIQLDPSHIEAHLQLGFLKLNIFKDVKESEDHYKTALEIDSTYAKAHNNYAAFLMNYYGNNAGAKEHLRKALGLCPSYAEAHYNLAIVYEHVNDNANAKEEYKSAIAQEPWYPKAHNNLAMLLENEGRFDEALKHYDLALQKCGLSDAHLMPHIEHNFTSLLKREYPDTNTYKTLVQFVGYVHGVEDMGVIWKNLLQMMILINDTWNQLPPGYKRFLNIHHPKLVQDLEISPSSFIRDIFIQSLDFVKAGCKKSLSLEIQYFSFKFGVS